MSLKTHSHVPVGNVTPDLPYIFSVLSVAETGKYQLWKSLTSNTGNLFNLNQKLIATLDHHIRNVDVIFKRVGLE
ncbi:hypothetical protein ACKGJO_05505 [Gracilimonas sp. Q87]|uniref:hypothetical protein n=1 Tax=Gracilimonas sp. Q87 TaxID=3384766 RepID=UPI0039841AD7